MKALENHYPSMDVAHSPNPVSAVIYKFERRQKYPVLSVDSFYMKLYGSIGFSVLAASFHLLLGYGFFHSDFLFPDQGSPIIGLLFVPFISFAAAHSVPISVFNFLLLLVIYLFLFRSKSMGVGQVLLLLLIPVVNIGCFALLLL